VAKWSWSVRRTRSQAVLGLNRALTTSWICFAVTLSSNPRPLEITYGSNKKFFKKFVNLVITLGFRDAVTLRNVDQGTVLPSPILWYTMDMFFITGT